MRDAPIEEVRAAVASARDDMIKFSKNRVLSYKEVEQFSDPKNITFFESNGFIIKNKPSLRRYVRLLTLNLTTPVATVNCN